MLAMECQSTSMWLTHHREHARSYRDHITYGQIRSLRSMIESHDHLCPDPPTLPARRLRLRA
ncbi:hypothetical protein DM828_06280 [Pseudomonas umsongensis]|nr:hypothetical protein [Pseudomonas umsongensis]